MNAFIIEIAGSAFQVRPLFETTRLYCREYLTTHGFEFQFAVTDDDLKCEQVYLNLEADDEGLKRRKFSEPFLERSFIQRRVAELLLERDVLLMHGSTIAVDGQAYLFTAPCGTGKSTHTRLWREVFGDRAVMINDDKPFLRFTNDGILAHGSPWTGKHGLGSNICCPLKGICILRRGCENLIRRTQPNAVQEFLSRQCFIPEKGSIQALELLDRLMAYVPLWEMECTKDSQAAFVAWQAMSCVDK